MYLVVDAPEVTTVYNETSTILYFIIYSYGH